MPNKQYKTECDNTLNVVSEPVAIYHTKTTETDSINSWNPNVPFCGTQEEWWEHFHQIEEGKFMTPKEYQKRFNSWKKDFLASRMK